MANPRKPKWMKPYEEAPVRVQTAALRIERESQTEVLKEELKAIKFSTYKSDPVKCPFYALGPELLPIPKYKNRRVEIAK